MTRSTNRTRAARALAAAESTSYQAMLARLTAGTVPATFAPRHRIALDRTAPVRPPTDVFGGNLYGTDPDGSDLLQPMGEGTLAEWIALGLPWSLVTGTPERTHLTLAPTDPAALAVPCADCRGTIRLVNGAWEHTDGSRRGGHSAQPLEDTEQSRHWDWSPLTPAERAYLTDEIRLAPTEAVPVGAHAATRRSRARFAEVGHAWNAADDGNGIVCRDCGQTTSVLTLADAAHRIIWAGTTGLTRTTDGAAAKVFTAHVEVVYRDCAPADYVPEPGWVEGFIPPLDRDGALALLHAAARRLDMFLAPLGGHAVVVEDWFDQGCEWGPAHALTFLAPVEAVMAAYPDPQQWWDALADAVRAAG